MDLTTREHRKLKSVLDLVEEWQGLHDASGDTNPFSGPDWAVAWLEHFTDGHHEPYVLEVRESGQLVGVAPLYLHKMVRGLATVVRPIGTGTPWIGPFEMPTLLAAPGLGRDVARAVVRHLCAHHEDWDWADLLLGQAAPWMEPEWLPDWSFTILQRRTRACVVLDLAGDVDVYAGRRNLKESFRRARNRLTRDVGSDGWSVRRVTAASEVGAAFDRLVALHGARADLREGRPVHTDVFSDPRVLACLRDIITAMSARDSVSVYELLIGDDVVASQLVLHTLSASYSSVSGAGERAWPYSAVTYLQSLAVQDAQKADHQLFNLSLGPNQAKLRWTEKVQVTPEFTLMGPRPRSRALCMAFDAQFVVARFRESRRAHRV